VPKKLATKIFRPAPATACTWKPRAKKVSSVMQNYNNVAELRHFRGEASGGEQK
jgi:hypothetical protein